MFFETDFDIATPRIWQAILGSDDTNGATTAHAQQDLSHQLDILESHLVSEITQRTPSFFSALSNLQSLTDQTSSCLSRLTSLRNELAELDRSTAIKGLKIVERQEDLHVARITERALGELEGVVGTLEVVKQVANEGDWVGAQEGLEDVGRWWLRMMPRVENAAKSESRRENVHPETNGKANSPDGKHVLSQVQEEDEEEVPASTSFHNPPTPNSSQPFGPLATLSAIQHFPEEMSTIAETIQNQLELSFASICAAMLDNTPPIELVSNTTEEEPSQGRTVSRRSDSLPLQWRIPVNEEERLRTTFADQVRALFHAFWRTDTYRNRSPEDAERPFGGDQNGSNSDRPTSISRIENVWRMAVLKSIKEGMRELLQLGGEADAEGVDGVADSSASGPAKGCVLKFGLLGSCGKLMPTI